MEPCRGRRRHSTLIQQKDMKRKTLLLAALAPISILSVALAQDQGVQSVIGNVFLQDTTPGTVQPGHASIGGTFRAGQVNVSQATGTTIPVIGNNNATGTGSSIGGSFSAAQESSIAVRGTATSPTGTAIGVRGETRAAQGTGVYGEARGTSAFGVWARNNALFGPALVAENTSNGLAARMLGRTEMLGAAFVQGSFAVRATDGFNLLRCLEFGGNESWTEFVKSGQTGSARIEAGQDEGHLILFSKNAAQVSLLADFNGVGRVTADVKNFVQPDPDNENRDIVYACVEGPEAAAYVRGTGKLVNGSAHVQLPRHFQNVSVADGMTVQVTPRSADSEGLAVVSQSNSGFEVRELRKGHGTYEFHWEVKAVRRGFTDYKVYQPWDESLAPNLDRASALKARKENARRVYNINYPSARP